MLNRNATSILVIQGHVIRISSGITWITCSTSGTFPVKWRNHLLPRGVRVGEYVTITGRLITMDLGKSFIVVRAEILRKKFLPELKKFIEGGKDVPDP